MRTLLSMAAAICFAAKCSLAQGLPNAGRRLPGTNDHLRSDAATAYVESSQLCPDGKPFRRPRDDRSAPWVCPDGTHNAATSGRETTE